MLLTQQSLQHVLAMILSFRLTESYVVMSLSVKEVRLGSMEIEAVTHARHLKTEWMWMESYALIYQDRVYSSENNKWLSRKLRKANAWGWRGGVRGMAQSPSLVELAEEIEYVSSWSSRAKNHRYNIPQILPLLLSTTCSSKSSFSPIHCQVKSSARQ